MSRRETSLTGYLCPKCGVPAVHIAQRAHIGTLFCTSCGWSISVHAWNKLSPAEKKAMYKKVKKKGGVLGKLKRK